MNSERHHKQSRKKVRMRLFWFIGFILISLYLWGTVQIDFDLRQNDRLKQEIESLQIETNDLRIKVNALASYQRIVTLASERGLVFLSANHKKELIVDWANQEISLEQEEAQIQYAGFF